MGAFAGCEKLKNIVFRNNLKFLGESCFAFCDIEKLEIPDNLIKRLSFCCDQKKELIVNERVFFSDNPQYYYNLLGTLYADDMSEWQSDISNSKSYLAKEMSVFENRLVC